ncbi:WbqC family protein [Streptosporangium sp. DT93]|uniref:WbqC family protein n=1 Tax=Streptosporangium sp. DT93 TaxID=3393428 RepID=UPI003CF693D2
MTPTRVFSAPDSTAGSLRPDPPYGEVCAIHQPNLFPRLVTLAKLFAADYWIVLDDVQFARRDYQHRARLASLDSSWQPQLPVAAIEAWNAHLAAQEAEQRRRAEEIALGERRPAGARGAVCPGFRSSFRYVVFTGPVVIALVNTADPAAGVQAAVADTDPATVDGFRALRLVLGADGRPTP